MTLALPIGRRLHTGMHLLILLYAGFALGRISRPPVGRPAPTGAEALALALLADGVCPRCLARLERGGFCELCGVRYIPADR